VIALVAVVAVTLAAGVVTLVAVAGANHAFIEYEQS